MKKSFVYPLFAITILLSACSTDLDVIGNYKETMVVYGLLDQSQPKQYIKINKAFLGEGDALHFAQIKDSVQFVNALNVVLKRFKGPNQIGSDIPLSPDNTIPKNSGVFYSPDQANAIYSTTATLFSDSEYMLVIKNSETGNEVSARTSLISDFSFTAPFAGSTAFNFVNVNNPDQPFTVEWNSAKNGKLYQLTIRLNYTDYLDNNSDNVVDDSVDQVLDWVLGTQKSERLDGTEKISNVSRGKDFIEFIGNQLAPYPNLFKRKAGNVELRVLAAGDDLNTFIEVNAPSTGIIQEKPEFTNVTNGLGIFSSRFNKAPFTRPLYYITLDTLACGQYTKDLKFLNSLKQVDGQGKPVTCP
ncbi:MAG: hypothetical protein ACT4ON_08150 [Bacteroidota bacterium]